VNLYDNILQQLFPELCLHCAEMFADSDLLCRECEKTLRKGPSNPETVQGMRRKYAIVYETAAKSLFAAAKFSDRRRAQNLLIEMAQESLKSLITESTIFIQMPSSRPFLRKVLRRIVPRRQLVEKIFTIDRDGEYLANKLLKEADRFQHVAATLRISASKLPYAENFVICDDVYTTGATSGHAAWLLRQAGIAAENITVWTLMFRERQAVEEPGIT
jgi:predicted amidophosphoribosyltransferase